MPPHSRARRTNHPDELPAGVIDARSGDARRMRDLLEIYEASTDPALLTEARRTMLRNVAALVVVCEQTERAIANGEAYDADMFVRCVGLTNRMFQILAIEKPRRSHQRLQTAEPTSLEEYIAAVDEGRIEADLIPGYDGSDEPHEVPELEASDDCNPGDDTDKETRTERDDDQGDDDDAVSKQPLRRN
jgi:hypothetical protein